MFTKILIKKQFFFKACFYIYVGRNLIFWWLKEFYMFSDEFMHFLIKYQQPSEPPKKISEIKTMSLPRRGNKLAEVFVNINK